MKKYQGMIILFAPSNEAALEATLEALRAEVVKLEGSVEALTRMGRATFARPLRKKESGVYVLITFTLQPAQLALLRERLKLNPDILRAQFFRAPTAQAPAPLADDKAAALSEKGA
ncbi:MAG: 30S ribosomal protein S6 [Lentisphaerae bacterium]|nr:30S ribosomal protein S6 [Lentisphaerota bacterium]